MQKSNSDFTHNLKEYFNQYRTKHKDLTLSVYHAKEKDLSRALKEMPQKVLNT